MRTMMIASSTIHHAVFDMISHSVTYDVNGGLPPAPAHTDVQKEDRFTAASYNDTNGTLIFGVGFMGASTSMCRVKNITPASI